MILTGQPLGQILKEMELVSEFDIQEALQVQKEKGGAIGRILVEKGLISEKDLTSAIGRQAGMDSVDLETATITSELIDMVPVNIAETYQVVPVEFDGSTLTLALSDPQNISVLDDLKFMLNLEVKGALADRDQLEKTLEAHYAGKSESMESIIGSMKGDDFEIVDDGREKMMDMEQLEKDVNAAPVVKLLNMVLLTAIKDRGS
ncbi:MAG TPA: hypothetical protein EYN79_04025, partial [Planctomycetes bacterium]|nr:hypothetical protein [Planctomycetota bacterium]